MRHLKVSELVIDMGTYPRREVDRGHVFGMIEALRSGAHLPPIVVEAGTRRVVDGVHRVTAYKEYEGPAHEIECIEKSYGSEKDFFLDALKYNSAHGKNLNRLDRERIVEIGATLGIDDATLAGSLLRRRQDGAAHAHTLLQARTVGRGRCAGRRLDRVATGRSCGGGGVKTVRPKAKRSKRTKACNCIGLVNDQLHERNARISRNFYLNGHLTEPLVTLEKIDEKKHGKLPVLYCSHCPFCGKKFPKMTP